MEVREQRSKPSGKKNSSEGRPDGWRNPRSVSSWSVTVSLTRGLSEFCRFVNDGNKKHGGSSCRWGAICWNDLRLFCTRFVVGLDRNRFISEAPDLIRVLAAIVFSPFSETGDCFPELTPPLSEDEIYMGLGCRPNLINKHTDGVIVIYQDIIRSLWMWVSFSKLGLFWASF